MPAASVAITATAYLIVLRKVSLLQEGISLRLCLRAICSGNQTLIARSVSLWGGRRNEVGGIGRAVCNGWLHDVLRLRTGSCRPARTRPPSRGDGWVS